MKIFLAGDYPAKNGKDALEVNESMYQLETFVHAEKNKHLPPLLGKFKEFMLDSGAFTYMQGMGRGDGMDWDAYVERYADFINRHNIDLFFELDMDRIIGLKEVERLRAKLQSLTGKKPIVVFQAPRGIDYWRKMCKEYPYVAIGASGKMESRYTRQKGAHAVLNTMIAIAHDSGAKVHGLGYTSIPGLEVVKWDSVDSTAWLFGNFTGFIYQFDGRRMRKHYPPKGKKLDTYVASVQNLREWVKFQHYADKHL